MPLKSALRPKQRLPFHLSRSGPPTRGNLQPPFLIEAMRELPVIRHGRHRGHAVGISGHKGVRGFSSTTLTHCAPFYSTLTHTVNTISQKKMLTYAQLIHRKKC